MIAARKSAVLIAAVSALLAAGACASENSQSNATPVASSSVAATPGSAAPTSTVRESEPEQEAVVVPTTRAPEEASDLMPWNQPRPSVDSGTVDPALYATDPGQYNFITPSGNVQCGIWAGGSPAGQVGCQAVTGVNPAFGRTCTNAENDKFAVRVDDGGSQHLCTTQGIYTSNYPRILDYGQVLSAVGVVCTSDDLFGVTCWGTHGAFTFGRDMNVTF